MADKKPSHCYELMDGTPLRIAARAVEGHLATAADLCETRRQWADSEMRVQRDRCLASLGSVLRLAASEAKAEQPPRGARLQLGPDAAWIGYDDPPLPEAKLPDAGPPEPA